MVNFTCMFYYNQKTQNLDVTIIVSGEIKLKRATSLLSLAWRPDMRFFSGTLLTLVQLLQRFFNGCEWLKLNHSAGMKASLLTQKCWFSWIEKILQKNVAKLIINTRANVCSCALHKLSLFFFSFICAILRGNIQKSTAEEP